MKQFKKILFTIAAAIAVASVNTAVAGTSNYNHYNTAAHQHSFDTNPVATDITMTPIVQASPILPFAATAINGSISSYTVVTVPPASEGVLTIDMNGTPMPISEGMMLSADLVNSITFTPDPSFTGDVVFTYSATDENSLTSNVASYTIPVVAKPPVILPVSLLNFTGNINNKKAQLQWQTTQENNSSYFELQRSEDGKSFETIATVTAKGNTSINNYQHTDDLFFYNYKTVYYRIKMVDSNGKFKYSGIVILELDATVKGSIKAWPLPFSSNLNIAYNSETDETVKITMHSVNGATVITGSSIVNKGNNNITFNQAQSIPPGTYLLTISSSTKAQTIKVIKN
jgi:hypothetical protein